ncbi:MAG: serine hydrolase [Pseudomonadota bacterium]
MVSPAATLAEAAAEAIEPDLMAGAVVGVYRHGAPLYRAGFGLADRERAVPFTPELRFRCCSITKQFTALLIALAEAEGRLGFDDHPARHLPWLGALDARLKLAHLLTNQSGIPDYWCLAMLSGARPESRFRLDDARRLLRAADWANFTPGARMAYCNSNFMILGMIAEAVFDAPLAELFSERIFEPLAMADSALEPFTAEPLARGATGYEADPSGRVVPATVDIAWYGDAALVSTIDDLARWSALFFGQGPPALVRAARRLMAPGDYADGTPAPYRWGLRRALLSGRDVVQHFGALRGWRSVLVQCPDDGVCVVVAFNGMKDPGRAAARIVAALHDAEPPPDPPDVGPKPTLRRFVGAPLEQVVEIYIGPHGARVECGGRSDALGGSGTRFRSVDGGVALELRDGGGALNYRHDNVRLDLEELREPVARPLSDGAYFCRALATRLVVDAQGTRLRLHGPLGDSLACPLESVGPGLALYRCMRALDHHPPGTFTVAQDCASGALRIGCWLAQGAVFEVVREPGNSAPL